MIQKRYELRDFCLLCQASCPGAHSLLIVDYERSIFTLHVCAMCRKTATLEDIYLAIPTAVFKKV